MTCIGTTDTFDPFAELETRLGRPLDREALTARRRQRFEVLMGGVGPLPGVAEYVAEARRLGLKLGVASSSGREWVAGHLARFGLLEHFHAVRTADDVARVKPEPDLFLAVLDALGVAPARALVLEDSPNGILAARRAGIGRVVAVPNDLTRGLDLAGADLVLGALTDLPLAGLLGRLGALGDDR